MLSLFLVAGALFLSLGISTDKVSDFNMPKDRIGGRFELGMELGRGKFGIVFGGKDVLTSQEVAVKAVISDPQRDNTLLKEYNTLKMFEDTPNVCRAIWYGSHGNYTCMVVERVGPNLMSIISRSIVRPLHSEHRAIELAIAMLATFESLHNKGILHCDVRPVNMAISRKRCGHLPCGYFLLDFDASRPYLFSNRSHYPYRDNLRPAGAGIVKSPYTMQGIARARRDDMISLGYTLIVVAKGKLPWDDVRRRRDREWILHRMKTTSIHTLCSGLPRAFHNYFDHILSLGFYDRPDYQRFIGEFVDARDNSLPWPPSMLTIIY